MTQGGSDAQRRDDATLSGYAADFLDQTAAARLITSGEPESSRSTRSLRSPR
ncbi:MAG: hypothetical protein HY996_00030 [Micrococcales bacterium]|nr:hypothetical protein [Micrococcales bacterium]